MDEAQIAGSAVEIAAASGAIDAQFFHPDAPGIWPGVVLLTDIRGSRPAFEDMGRHLAAHGYAVLLPNLYYRGGRAPVVDPSLPVSDEGARARRGALRAALTPEAWRADLAALLGFLDGNERVHKPYGIVGYCMSGSFALRGAADFPDQIAAAASFHGGGLASDAADSPHLRAGEIKARLYFGHAENDGSMPAEAIARLDDALREAGVSATNETYAGARHGFAVADGQAYNTEAASRHWRNLLQLFDGALAPAKH